MLRADAGLGKSALLDYAARQAYAFIVLRASGVEAESELDFAGLHSLVRPILGLLDEVPAPQREALSGAVGLLSAQATADRFLVSAGVLSLLAAAAEQRPLLCLVDDAQWLDAPSADSLAFAARGLGAEGAVLLFATREEERSRFDATGIPELVLAGLDRDCAIELLARRAEGAAPAVRERLVREAAGNPLALLELPAALSEEQLAGRAPLLDPIPLTSRLQDVFRSRVECLPASTQTALQLVAADEAGELPVILAAIGALDISADVFDPAEDAGLIQIAGGHVVFRHPLVRTAVYESATFGQRRRAHSALARAYSADQHADVRVWHLAAAAVSADENIAQALEHAAQRSQARGGHASAATALERAAGLSEGRTARGRRLAAAAHAAYVGGQIHRAADLVTRALPDADRGERARLLGVRGIIDGFGFTRLLPEAVTTLEEAIACSDDASLSLQLLLEAVGIAMYMADYDRADALCKRAAELTPVTDVDRVTAALLAAGRASDLEGDHARAVEFTAQAAELAERLDDATSLIWVAGAIGRAGHWGDGLPYASRAVQLARDRGLIAVLPYALQAYATQLLGQGRFDLAYAAAEEGWGLAQDVGLPWAATWALADLAMIDAIRGDEARAMEHLDRLREYSSSIVDLVTAAVGRALGMLELGAGRPSEALEHLLTAVEVVRPESNPVVLSGVCDAVEAAVRAQRLDAVMPHFKRLEGWIERFPHPARVALLERCRALLDERNAERHYRDALAHAHALNAFERARTELLYGEWLRRERRRIEARTHLRTAFASFDQLRAAPWAERCRAELRASGETARRRDAAARDQLTPQELQIALFAADGRTNPEIAAQLFLSPRTIDYHLRKVFAKLDITSRSELSGMELRSAVTV